MRQEQKLHRCEPDPRFDARARDFAIAAHGAQRYGVQPYVVHLDAVANIVRKYSTDPQVIAAAYLHDVLEDVRGVSDVDIRESFGAITAGIVKALTKPGGAYDAATYLRGIRHTGADAVLVKLADRLANMRASVIEQPSARLATKYRDEMALFRSILYHPGEYEALWAELACL